MAKVAATNGREADRRARAEARRFGSALVFAEAMLHGRDFALHVAHLHVLPLAAGSIEEINNTARQRADQDDEEAERADQVGDALLHAREIVEQNLEDDLAPA